MPELPFLEILAENLAAKISGRRIESIQLRQPALLQTSATPPESFAGEFLSLPTRAGKYLILETESRRAIVIHLMRAGRIVVAEGRPAGARSPAASAARIAESVRPAAWPKNVSARIRLDDGSEVLLLEHGKEKRVRLWLLEDVADLPDLGAVGPDPSRGELTLERFRTALRSESRRLKTMLTDQRAIGGIGNGLSDEILYEARLSPMKLTSAITDPEAAGLHAALLQVVSAHVEKLREQMTGELPSDEPRDLYAVHNHAGELCPRCGGRIARISYADRETFYCPGCQTGGKPLKDRRLSRLLK